MAQDEEKWQVGQFTISNEWNLSAWFNIYKGPVEVGGAYLIKDAVRFALAGELYTVAKAIVEKRLLPVGDVGQGVHGDIEEALILVVRRYEEGE